MTDERRINALEDRLQRAEEKVRRFDQWIYGFKYFLGNLALLFVHWVLVVWPNS
jgi:hypothetical protein